LANPGVLVCPADTRFAATNFAALQNSNLSYFVGLNAELGKPTSILAGDRNLTNDWGGATSLLYLGPNNPLRWTRELHQFKGNLLFADGHVEEWNNAKLWPLREPLQETADLSLPSVPPADGGASTRTSTAGGAPAGGAYGGYAGSTPAASRSAYPQPSPASPFSSGASGGGADASAVTPYAARLSAAPTNSWELAQKLRMVAAFKTEDAATNAGNSAPVQAELATSMATPVKKMPWFAFSPLFFLLLLAAEIYRQERARRKSYRSRYRARS
jgi:prepilin-type processing-associated H-X9-DG protein